MKYILYIYNIIKIFESNKKKNTYRVFLQVLSIAEFSETRLIYLKLTYFLMKLGINIAPVLDLPKPHGKRRANFLPQ